MLRPFVTQSIGVRRKANVKPPPSKKNSYVKYNKVITQNYIIIDENISIIIIFAVNIFLSCNPKNHFFLCS